MTRGSYLSQLLSVIVVLGFSGVFKECWTQEDITSPVILVHPHSVNIRITRSNQNTTLMCLAIAGSNVTYKWERENSSLPNKTVGQDTHQLTLLGLRPSDSGNYRCRVSNMHGTTFSNYAYVNVTGSLRAVVEPHNSTVEITTSVNLSCIASGYEVDSLRYAWEVIQIREEVEPSRIHDATSSHLLLNNITTSAAYRCVVTSSDIGTTAISAFSYITVVVHSPRIIAHPISKSVELHDSNNVVNISFSCAGTASPSHYHWERLQGSLPVNSQGGTTDTLVVYNIQPSDSGFYRCSVSNNNETAYSNYATLNVTVHPPNITAAYTNQSIYRVGSQAVFVCKGVGYGRFHFNWQRQTGNIPPSAAIDTSNGTLIIPVLSSSDKGNYRCVISDDWNGIGYSEYIQLNVTEKPLVINANPMLAKQQSNVSFSCMIVDRHVDATFLWSRVDGKPLSNRAHGSNSSVLIIVRVREEDEAEYNCTATTGNQTLTETASLTVYGIPMVHQMKAEHVANVSEKLVLTCTAQNDPDSPHPLEMAWYKGNTQLHRGQRYTIRNILASNIFASNNIIISTLTITDVQKDDAGRYSCRVKPGDISTETTVVVNYKPEIVSFQILPQNSVMLGEAIQILCQVDANPLPSVTIYRNSKAIFTTTRRVVDHKILQVSADDDNTMFSCGAENDVGTISRQNVTLTVTGIPTIRPSATASTIMASASTTSISSTPTPYPVANVRQISRGLTSVQLQWTGLQEEISYFRVRLYCVSPCTGNAMKSFTTMDTSITVYGLEPDHTYAVQVATVTSDGVTSVYSEPLQVSTAASDSVLFQLRLVSEKACNEWKAKLDVITPAIVNDIIEHCTCPLSTVDTFSDTISCDNEDHVIYRAGFTTSARLDAEEILTILNAWAAQTSTLVVDGSPLQVDHNCPLVLSSFDDPTCSSTSSGSPDSDSNIDVIPVLAGIIGGIIIGGVLITILIVILVIKCRGKTDKIRPGGNTSVQGSLKRPQRRPTGRRTQTNEEATYSEVFNNLPLCAVQSCPAYQASVHFDDHDYVDIEEENGNANISADIIATKAGPAQSHNEIELSASPSSVARSNGNDYSEPLRLSQELDSRTSRVLLTQMASKGCSDYLKPINHKTGSKDSGVDSASSQTYSPQEEKVPSDYIEPVSVKDSQEHLNFHSKHQQYDHLSSRSKVTNIYSELD